MVRLLIDQEAVLSGATRDGAAWKFYDPGHSYCTNAFWSTCPHRMACAGCSFNLPKASAEGMAIEARASVTRLLEEVPLSSDERVAAEGDLAALDGMLAKLRDMPALDGRTPRRYTLPTTVPPDDRNGPKRPLPTPPVVAGYGRKLTVRS